MNELPERLLIDLIPGGVILLCSIFFIRFPPKSPNHWYGYRTLSSMKNQETWDEANRYSARLMLLVSFISLAIGILSAFLVENQETSLHIATIGMIVLLIAIIPLTEARLKRKFHKDGSHK